MKLIIDSKHKDSLSKACIEHDYQVQFHELPDKNVVHVYITNRGNALTESQSFWLGVWFQAELSRVLLESNV